MKKIVLIIIFFLCVPFNVKALEMIDLLSSNYLVYDLTDEKIAFEKDKDEIRTVASLTKILTAITVIENQDNLSEEIEITNSMISSVPWDAYKIGLKAGDVYTFDELLHSLLMKSDATSANSLAIKTSGSIKDFVELMNLTAKKIGIKNSIFTNPIGMDTNGNKSSCEDIKKILQYALKNEKFKKIYTTTNFVLNTGIDVTHGINSINEKLEDYVQLRGYKTGYTASAGLCMAFYFESRGHEYLAVILNAHETNEIKNPNFNDMVEIIKFMSSNFDNQVLVDKKQIIKKIKVVEATVDEYDVFLSQDVIKYLSNDFNKDLLKINYSGLDSVDDKIKFGQKIGNVKVYYNDELLLDEDVMLKIKIEHTIKQLIKKYKIVYIVVGVFAIWLFKKMFLKKVEN